MKEIHAKLVVPQSVAEREWDVRTIALTESAVKQVDQVALGNYYQRIPGTHKQYIDDMVIAKATDAGSLFDGKLHQDISREWLIRQSVIPNLMAEEGFRNVSTLPQEPRNDEFNNSKFACLTGKGTVLILGEGGLLPHETGASIVWDPLPTLRNKDNQSLHFQRGARVIGKPEIGKRLEVQYTTLKDDVPIMDMRDETAPLMAIFKASKGASLETLRRRIKVSDAYIQRMRP